MIRVELDDEQPLVLALREYFEGIVPRTIINGNDLEVSVRVPADSVADYITT